MWVAGNAAPPGAGGFTLLEMLVITGIVALLSGLAFPSIATAMDRQNFLAATLRLETALRTARAAAIRSGTSVHLTPTPDRRGLNAGRLAERFEPPLVLTLPDTGIVFFADGSASGGQVTLADGRRDRRWRVRAATGAIEVQP